MQVPPLPDPNPIYPRRGHMARIPYRARNSRRYIRSRTGVLGYVRRVAHVRSTVRNSRRFMNGLALLANRARNRIAIRRMRQAVGRRR